MIRLATAALLLGLPHAALGQTAITGDAWVLGRVAVGTTTATARLTVVASSSTNAAFQVSGVDLTPLLRVGRDGTVGLSTSSAANLDVMGSADDSDAALELRSGTLYGGGGRTQIAFGQDASTDRRHAINSVHIDSTAHNSLDFLVWTPDAGTASIATMTVLSLVTISSASGASAHVRPVGEPMEELVVSDGGITGGGTIHAAAEVTPSSRKLKTDIAYLDGDERLQAYENVKSLRHVSFRYMKRKGNGYARDRRAPVRRGLLYEEAPQTVRGKAESLSLDQRLLESELAFQELARRLEGLQKEASR